MLSRTAFIRLQATYIIIVTQSTKNESKFQKCKIDLMEILVIDLGQLFYQFAGLLIFGRPRAGISHSSRATGIACTRLLDYFSMYAMLD